MRIRKRKKQSSSVFSDKEISFSISPYWGRKYIEPKLRTRGEAAPGLRNLNEDLHHVFSEWREIKGKGIRIAVLDTGIDPDHPSFSGNIKALRNFTGSTFANDEEGHGTMVAGIIAASDLPGAMIGVAPESEIYVGKIIRNLNGGTKEHLIQGIEWAMGRDVGGGEQIDKVDIIHLSLTSEQSDEDLHDIIKEAISDGLFVICAAGNKGDAGVEFPAKYEESIAVGAVNSIGNRLALSAKGPELDFVALGDLVESTFPTYFEDSTGFSVNSGTSLAAPFVTGVSALALAKHRQIGGNTPITNQEQLVEHLKRIALDLPPTGLDPNTGFGLIDPEEIEDEEL
jgi:subtilisin family serine protease